MPEISLFYGIRITMYYDDHNPPHFHAEYNGNTSMSPRSNVNDTPSTAQNSRTW